MNTAYLLLLVGATCASTEAAIRYLFWWPRAREEDGHLSTMVLGVGITQAGIAIHFATVICLVERHPTVSPSDTLLAGVAIIAVGTLLKLAPSWRIAYRRRQRRAQVALRLVALATILALFANGRLY